MARTAIPVYVTNQVITAAHGNTYWRANEAAHWPYTAAGDMPYATAADALAPLAIGTAGQIQRVNAGATAPEWGGLLNCRVSDATARSINNATDTEVTLTVEDVDIDGFVANPVNNRITIPAGFSGWYFAFFYVSYEPDAAGFRDLRIRINDVTAMEETRIRKNAINGGNTEVSGCAIVQFTAADYLELWSQQNSGGALNIDRAYLGLALLSKV